jgi:N-acyl-L-homoserine lactone synthetase
MIKISAYDSQLIDEIIKFRSDAYLNSGRDPTQTDAWSRDEFDARATHVLMYNEVGKIIGAVRIIDGDRWTIEHYFDFDYDKQNGVEFGRLAITQPAYQGKRVLAELIKAACRHCAEDGKTHFYGFVISRLKRELQRLGVPFEVLSPSSSPMGEESSLIRFRIDELMHF